ncbi:MAG: CBS domain-containing protein [Kiritimatiellales bacterium]|nr:CBS domain-containing protein [Kiritimatiellales bacterium]
MSPALQPTEEMSLRIQELAGNLKIRDVMTRKVFAVTRHCTMRDVQTIMKNNAISGVPVVDDRHVIGLISVHDIMNAYEQEWMADAVADHMTTGVRTLAEEQPLSIAMSAFSKFPYRRFPVVNRNNELTGMVTLRNINMALIQELSRQLDAMETEGGRISPATSSETFIFYRVYRIARYDFEAGGKASAELREQLQARGISPKIIRRAAVACYELEINIIAHSFGGTLTLYVDKDRVRITANDFGPGIPDIEEAMTEGFSTATDWIRSQGFGAGMGLPNTKRLSDEFAIQSGIDMGTMVKAIIHLNPQEKQPDENE